MNNISVIGLDIAKNTFNLVGINEHGKTVMKQAVKRVELVKTLSNVPRTVIGMESCGSCHYWYRQLSALGHTVKLIAPQYVKAYGIGGRQKNDFNDARNIAEAVSRKSIPLVCPKNEEQQHIQALLRMRDSLIAQRTKLCNQARALLYEHGEVVRVGIKNIQKAMLKYLDNDSMILSSDTKFILNQLKELFDFVNQQILSYERKLKKIAVGSEKAQRILTVPGVGLITTMAIIANLGDPHYFKNGRHYSAYLGLVPRQHSSGGKTSLGKISKQGEAYIRQLLIHGARAIIRRSKEKETPLYIKIEKMKQRMHTNKLCAAVANHLARVIWALVAHGTAYEPNKVTAT